MLSHENKGPDKCEIEKIDTYLFSVANFGFLPIYHSYLISFYIWGGRGFGRIDCLAVEAGTQEGRESG